MFHLVVADAFGPETVGTFEFSTSNITELAAMIDGRRTPLLEVDGRYLSSEDAELLPGGFVVLEGEVCVEWFD
ncbi:hypothetical protein J7E25_05745 [Agromyces sp. ISL-38]|uniref:hypothetical protein n=1 Tax=Agromyces sp. ISL-38 TaxID=2819107 RepID=UPI001BECCDC8|nr:hypothetical protein [Agromyces sp. ISL-38]MBT2498592.1 hypothetical protein [Agromyces sp. ISL-38]